MFALQLVLLLTVFGSLVNAGLYVINPIKGSSCQANRPCIVNWVEDGQAPPLSQIGVTTIGLYTGDQQLVQSIPPVNVGLQSSLNFTPIPEAGPNSDTYYLSFQSTSLLFNGSAYTAFSPCFSLFDMTGSFATPLPSATSSKPVPSSLSLTPGTTTSTITVGTLVTPSQPSSSSNSSTTFATSRFSTSVSSLSTSSTPSSSPPSLSSSTTSPSSPSSSSSPAQNEAVRPTTNLAMMFSTSIVLSSLLGVSLFPP